MVYVERTAHALIHNLHYVHLHGSQQIFADGLVRHQLLKQTVGQGVSIVVQLQSFTFIEYRRVDELIPKFDSPCELVTCTSIYFKCEVGWVVISKQPLSDSLRIPLEMSGASQI